MDCNILEFDHDVTLQKVVHQFCQHAQQPEKVLNVTNLCQNVEQDESPQFHLPLKNLGLSICLGGSAVLHLQNSQNTPKSKNNKEAGKN
jgi:hypothetical protein